MNDPQKPTVTPTPSQPNVAPQAQPQHTQGEPSKDNKSGDKPAQQK
jgi:hypothetical protein